MGRDPATHEIPADPARQAALIFQHILLHPENFLPIEKVELLSRATLAECDAKDGLKDGLISDPRVCALKPEALKCTGTDGPDCLTARRMAR